MPYYGVIFYRSFPKNWVTKMRRSSDSDFGLRRNHHIDLIIILYRVFHEQQLLIIVVNVLLHEQLDICFSKVEESNYSNVYRLP